MNNFKMMLFLVCLATICTLFLAGAQTAYQKAEVLLNRRLYKEILAVFGLQTEKGDVEDTFKKYFTVRQSGNQTFYMADASAEEAIVTRIEGAGLWSRIELLLAFSADRERLLAMRVLSQAETPGLGGRIAEPDFQSRFENCEVKPVFEIVKFAVKPNQVDGISGATKTCDAVERIINDAVKLVDANFSKRNSR